MAVEEASREEVSDHVRAQNTREDDVTPGAVAHEEQEEHEQSTSSSSSSESKDMDEVKRAQEDSTLLLPHQQVLSEEQLDLKGKVVVVTGATSGIGLEVATELGRRGAKVIFGVRNMEKAARVMEDIHQVVPQATLVAEHPVDFADLESVRSFAEYLLQLDDKIDILVLNAAMSYMTRRYSEQGVGGLAQVNHLGPYALVRHIEQKLAASKTRVVVVASVTHRIVQIESPETFLYEWLRGQYPHTKLANVLFAFELQRRLGPLGVETCAVDPGAVNTSVWDNVIFGKPPFKNFIEWIYSPPSDGAAVVVHAATVPWQKDQLRRGMASDKDLRYYARGLFASPTITWWDGPCNNPLFLLLNPAYMAVATLHSLLDYPIRKRTGGRLLNMIKPVRAAGPSYDRYLAARLWDISADIVGLPHEVTAA